MGVGVFDSEGDAGDDHLPEEDFGNGKVDVCTQEFKRKEPTVGFSWKPSSHPPPEWGARIANLSVDQQGGPIKLNFVSGVFPNLCGAYHLTENDYVIVFELQKKKKT